MVVISGTGRTNIFIFIVYLLLKNPIGGRPIVAGYDLIPTPASIFVGHYLKEFFPKFTEKF